jgi:hypothetical protein
MIRAALAKKKEKTSLAWRHAGLGHKSELILFKDALTVESTAVP